MSIRSTKLFELLENCTTVLEASDPKLKELRDSLQDEQMLTSITHPETGNTLLHEAVQKNKVLLVKTVLSLPQSDEYLVQHKNSQHLSSLDLVAGNKDTLPEIETLLKTTIVAERAKEFVLQLLEQYCRKYNQIRKRVVGDPISINAQSVQGHANNVIRIGSRAVGYFVAGNIVTTFIDLVTFRRKRSRASRIWKAHHQFSKLQTDPTIPQPLARLLIRDGFEIFGALEEHLSHCSYEDFQDWRNHGAWKLAKECVSRMLDYIENHTEDIMGSQGHFCRCFVEGRLHGLQRVKPGKLAVVDKAGVVMMKKEDETGEQKLRHFRRSTGPTDKLQFRKAFEFEKRNTDFLQNFEEVSNEADYKFLLTGDLIDKAVKELLIILEYEEEEKVENAGSSGTSGADRQYRSDGRVCSDAIDFERTVLLASGENIDEIVQDWTDSAMSETLCNSWPKLAYKVGLAPQQVSELRKKLRTTELTVYNLTVLILSSWAMPLEGEPGATVGNLIDKLEALRWTEYARLVKIRFGL